MARRLTQKEIAKRAGVSQATVSLVLNGGAQGSQRIPEETRQRIQQVIADTGYVADPVARRMVNGRNNILGVFTYEPAFPQAQADFFAPLLFGIEAAAQERGYDLLLMTSAGKEADGSKRIFGKTSRLRIADGCILLGRKFDADELALMVKDDFAFVAIGRRDDAGGPVPYVGADYTAATRALVDRARSLGHRKFAYVGQSDGAESIADRWAGFGAGLAEGDQLVLHVDEVGLASDRLVDEVRISRATVVFFIELADAIPFKRAATAAGLNVPGDISIVVLGSHIRPDDTGTRFTTYSIPREEMARKAALALISWLEGQEHAKQTLLSCALIDGETLGINKETSVT
ncbi:LacI family DNA-binding transcriptional regulator [Pseudoruegeria sp. SK021]|uniref:LacI family DNA-binding transcriptional regulator n=1 Tax=Pseudoruegeria sp. SK021 TaxID=1933035 RepID=UPI000A246388|nr:LacI family DNA-binding transcriptional regulator [Pseudoruegeria sp. SK021]OSP55772.1 LacI family transcriptional regulator [Pseudoruegeria sp. SK021]